jgi:hypothetical protein
MCDFFRERLLKILKCYKMCDFFRERLLKILKCYKVCDFFRERLLKILKCYKMCDFSRERLLKILKFYKMCDFSRERLLKILKCYKMCDFFRERLLKILKCYNFLWVQRRHNCSPAASFANCVMTLHLLKVHLRTFLSIPILVTQKCQILSCDTLVANERYHMLFLRLWVKWG